MSFKQVTDELVKGVEGAERDYLAEYYSELFPGEAVPINLQAADLVARLRAGLDPEELVDLWNVVFPTEPTIWYNEEIDCFIFHEQAVDYAQMD